jgi:hypothetical protein
MFEEGEILLCCINIRATFGARFCHAERSEPKANEDEASNGA